MELKKVIDNIKNFEDYKRAKSLFFSKNAEIEKLKQELKVSSREQKAEIGRKINAILEAGRAAFEAKFVELQKAEIDTKLAMEKILVEKPVTSGGGLTPITKIIRLMRVWFFNNGYVEKKVGEVETDEYNFQKLNIPLGHPARDMQDSLYISNKTLLRTHNTGGTVRMMVENAPRAFAGFIIGNVYRNDAEDESHSHQFVQCDLVNVGNVSIENLVWTLKSLLSFVFEEDLKIRLRPSYFPFTEPSCEVDIFYKDKWVEVLGAGMLHPNVLKMSNYDSNAIQAFAAGIGIERLAMIKYEIKDIRNFYLNDLRFNKQFRGNW